MQYLGIRGNIFGNPYIATNNRIVAYRDAAKDGAIAVDDNIILEDGVTVNALNGVPLSIEREALGTKGYALIEFYMIAEDAGGTNDNTRAMVNGKMTSNGSGRVYINARLAMGHFGDNARDEGYAKKVQFVSYAIVADSTYGWITTDHLAIARGCRITFIGCNYISSKQATQVGQTYNELADNTLSFTRGAITLSGKVEAGLNLIHKFVIEAFDVDARVIGDSMATDTRMPEVPGKKDGTAKVDNLVQFTKRGKRVPISGMT